MFESISKILSSIFGNERIQGLLAGMLIGLFASMLIYGYRISKVDIAGIHFENTDEIILTHERQISALEEQNASFKDRIAKLENELHASTKQLGMFEGKLVFFEAELIRIRGLR